MSVSLCHVTSWLAKSPKLSRTISATPSTAAFDMDLHDEGRANFVGFPYVSVPHRKVMVDLVSTVEDRLGSQLLPCTLPHDVQSYQNPTGTAHGSLHIRSGLDSSPIDFMLGSWIHCELPTGAALNITSLSTYLNSSTDAPNFLVELIRSSPTSLVFILDLPPRRDLVLNPDYLATFYEGPDLESRRRSLAELPQVHPFFSSSLYIRTIVSPTAIMVRVEAGDAEAMDEIIETRLGPVAREVLGVWLDLCWSGQREVGEEARAYLRKRDEIVKTKTIEIDLASSLPRILGDETAGRVMAAVRKYFSAS